MEASKILKRDPRYRTEKEVDYVSLKNELAHSSMSIEMNKNTICKPFYATLKVRFDRPHHTVCRVT